MPSFSLLCVSCDDVDVEGFCWLRCMHALACCLVECWMDGARIKQAGGSELMAACEPPWLAHAWNNPIIDADADARSWSIRQRVLESHFESYLGVIISFCFNCSTSTIAIVVLSLQQHTVVTLESACAIGHPSATYSFATQYEPRERERGCTDTFIFLTL